MKFSNNSPEKNELNPPLKKQEGLLNRRNFLAGTAKRAGILAGTLGIGTKLKMARDDLIEERERTSIERKHYTVFITEKHHQPEKFLNPVNEFRPTAKYDPTNIKFSESFTVTVDVFGKSFVFTVNKELFNKIKIGDKVEIELEEKYESVLNKETGQLEKFLKSEEIIDLKQMRPRLEK